jgi:hypothetical protein
MDSAGRGNANGVDQATLARGIVEINDRLAAMAPTDQSVVTFLCECGNCLAVGVTMSLEQFDQMRAREELILAPNHH